MAKRTAKQWLQRIQEGEAWRSRLRREEMWKRHIRWYSGEFQGVPLPLNLNFAHVKTTLPRVYFNNPRVNAPSLHPGMYWESKVVESLSNILLRAMLIGDAVRSQIFYALLCGTGPAVMGYDSKITPSLAQAMSGTVPMFDKAGRKLDLEEAIRPGLPWFLDVRPFEFIVRQGLRKWRDADWAAVKIVMPLEKAKAHPLFGSKKKDLQATLSTEPETGVRTVVRPQDEEESKEQMTEVYQVRDFETGNIIVVSEGVDGFLRHSEDVLGNVYFPLQFNAEWSEDFWCPSDSRIIEPQQWEVNDIREQAQKHRRAGNLRFLYRDGSLDVTEMDKLQRGDVMAGVAVGGDPNTATAFFNPPAKLELLTHSRVVQRDVREMLGVSSVESGEMAEGRHTATEVQRAGVGVVMRMSDKRAIVARMLEKVVRRALDSVFNFWTADRIIEVVGPMGVKLWVRWRGRQLRGNYDISIDPESSLPVTTAEKKREAAVVWAALQEAPEVNRTELIKRCFSTMDWLDVASLVQAPQQQALPGGSPGNAVPVAQAGGAFQKAVGGRGGKGSASLQVQMHEPGMRTSV